MVCSFYTKWHPQRAEGYTHTEARLVSEETRFLKRRSYTQDERTLSVADYVGFTEEESQAWLRYFRLLQHKNGESPAINVSFFELFSYLPDLTVSTLKAKLAS